MNSRIQRTIGTAFALLLALSTNPSHSQTPGTAAQTSRAIAPPTRGSDDALLKELRLIREILQRAQGGAQREQMLVERIRTHDQRVERLDRQLTELRDEIGGIEVHIRQTNERDQSLDRQIQRAGDAAQRQALEGERKEMRFTQEAQRQRLDSFRERESAIAAALLREERTLRGLEVRLEALDRELETEARRNNGASQPAR